MTADSKVMLYKNMADMILHFESLAKEETHEFHDHMHWEINGFAAACRIMFPEDESTPYNFDWAVKFITQHPFEKDEFPLHGWMVTRHRVPQLGLMHLQ
jgi:hypothetical protein